MTNNKYTILAAGALFLATCLVGINSVSAQTTTASTSLRTPKTAATSSPKVTAKLVAQADKEITNRITALNKLVTRIGQMKNVTDAGKTNLTAKLQSQITTLTNLKTKIDADTDETTLRTDLQSITANLRIYVLVIPQGQIIAAADRLNTIASDLAAVGTKLQTRITAAQTAGKDVTTIQVSLTDLQSKASDAQTQAQTAITTVSTLTPDQGNATTSASNLATLKQARTDIQTGTKDVQAARKDAGDILKAIKALKIPVTATSTATTTSH